MEESNFLNLIASVLPQGTGQKLDFSIFGKMLSGGEEEETPYFDQTAENMFPEEFLPEDDLGGSDVLDEVENFIPSMFPESRQRNMGELGVIPNFQVNDSAVPDLNLLSGMNRDMGISDDLMKKIEQITDAIQTQSEKEKKMINQLDTFKPTVNSYAGANILDKNKKISATLGYDEDIAIFLGNIKNPPEWRVLD